MTARDEIIRWWRDEKHEDYMGGPEGFADELIAWLSLKGYEFTYTWVGEDPRKPLVIEDDKC